MAGDLLILNPSVMSWEHQRQFFGDIFHYQTIANITIAGNVLDLQKQSEEDFTSKNVWRDIELMLQSGKEDFRNIKIRNVSTGESKDIILGSGKVNSFTWEEGVDVIKKGYQMSLTIYEEGNLDNLSGAFYGGIVGRANDFYKIDKLEENFDYSNSDTNNSRWTHSINLRVHSGIKVNDNPIEIAKSIARILSEKNTFTGIYATGENEYYKRWSGQYFKTYTESYNLITNECSFTENCEFGFPSGKYSITYTHRTQINENGITSVSENGKIIGLKVTEYDGESGYYAAAKQGFESEKTKIYDRILEIFGAYKPGDSLALGSLAISKGIQINKNLAEINYSFTYDNDPRHQGSYSWEYTDEISTNEDGTTQISENGIVSAFDRRGAKRYSNALLGYQAILVGLPTRIGELDGGTLNLKKISSTVQKSEFQGRVNYSEVYTDNPSVLIGGGIIKIDTSIDDTIPIKQLNKFNVVKYKEIVQTPDVYTVGNRSISINILGKRTTGLDEFMTIALETGFNPYSEIGYDSYLVNKEYSITSGTAPTQFNFKADIVFHSGEES